MTEAQLHRACAGFLSWALPTPDAWFTTFPAGGGGEMRGKILHASGLKAGVPDLLIVFRGEALWVELKALNGRVNHRQIECHTTLVQAGCRAPAIVHSLEELKATLEGWGILLRRVSLTTERLQNSLADALSKNRFHEIG